MATPAAAKTPPKTVKTPAKPAATQQSGMTYAQVENTWIQAGGNPQAAAMAAAVSDASSGFNPTATRTNPDGTTSIGLWLIPKNGTPPGSTDPMSNARAAVQLSSNGTDWSQWCVTWSDNNCGCDGGCYLGEGANALGALAGKLGTSSYNVIGSAPSGTNQGASATTSGTTASTTGTPTSSSKSMLFLVLGLIVIVVIYVARKAQKTAPLEEVPQ